MREPSDNRRRLAALAGLAVLWGALLVSIGLAPLLVAGAVAAGIAVAAIAFEGRRVLAAAAARVARADWAKLREGLRRGALATARIARRGATVAWRAGLGMRAVFVAAVVQIQRGLVAASARVARIDWARLRDRGGGVAHSAARIGRQGAVAAGSAAQSGSRRAVVAAKAARNVQLPRLERPDGRRDARTLNERAAACRQAGQVEEAIVLGEQALAIFRERGDRHGEALTLNGLGLAQARIGDEASALDSYETAVALLTVLGDSHGAGRVLANLGALYRGQGQDEQARACLHDALERFEPGSVEHDRTAQQLRLAG